MSRLSRNLKPLARKNLLFRELDDGGVIYEPQSETIHSLNSTSAYIWALCDGTYSIKDIINSVQKNFKEFEADPEKEVYCILEKFQKLGLLISSS